MPKHTHAQHHPTHHEHKMLKIGILILVIFIILAGLKAWVAHEKWTSYVVNSQTNVMKLNTANSIEDANAIATTIVSIPLSSPLLNQPGALQAYIGNLSKQMGRDIVVVEYNGTIMADTIPANIGQKYAQDENGEVMMTIADGQPRTFVERSADYPKGIPQTVISFKDMKGSVVGAIVISNSNIFK